MTDISEAALCTAALRLVAGKRITSLTQGTPNANDVNDLYTTARDDLLGDHNWNFATRRAKLARSSTAPTFEFDYAYVLPSDWVRTISVHNNDNGVGTVLHREEEVDGQGVICASVEDLYLRYVALVTDPNRMPVKFRRALISALARDLAMPVANSNTVREFYAKQAKSDLLKAKAADAMGASPEARPRGSWATSRGGWRTSTIQTRS